MTCTRQLLSDLLWVVNSPMLLATNDQVVSGHWRIREQDVDAMHLARFMEQKSLRSLGKYFEGLVSYWLQHLRKVDLLFESYVIRDHKRTIGEVDFIFIDEHGRTTHWEVAVKFYLFNPQECVLGSPFIGPNANDTLDRKLHRLFDHQLTLGKQLLPDVDVEIREAFVKGRIFYPDGQADRSVGHPGLSSAHLKGSWFRHSEFRPLQDDPAMASEDVRYCWLEKPNWLSVIELSGEEDDLLSFDDLSGRMDGHFANSKRCPLVVQLKSDGTTFHESRRFFVVPDGWPGVS